jgi:hypothetical protein
MSSEGDMTVPRRSQRKLVGRKVGERNRNFDHEFFETLGIYFLGSYMDEVLQNTMAGRTNGAVQCNTWVKLVELKLIELSKYPVRL